MQVMGFGQYITSGFSQYKGHSAIGIGHVVKSSVTGNYSVYNVIVGVIQSTGNIEGVGFQSTGRGSHESVTSVLPDAMIVF